MPDPDNKTGLNPTYLGNENPTPQQRALRIAHDFDMKAEMPIPPVKVYRIIQAIEEEIQSALDQAKPAKPTYPVGVSVLLTIGGRLLLGRRKNNKAAGWLGTPGGRLEPGETILQCAEREFFEETGAHIAEWKTDEGIKTPNIFYAEHHWRFDDDYVMVYVHATGYNGQIENKEPDKCEGWRWYPGYDIIDRTDVTEPKNILEKLPLTWRRPVEVVDPVFKHGWNAALNKLKDVAAGGYLHESVLDTLRK